MREPNHTLVKPLGTCSLEAFKASCLLRVVSRTTLERALVICALAGLRLDKVEFC